MSGFKEEYNLIDKDIDDTDDKVIQMEVEDKKIINKPEQKFSQKIEISIIIFFINQINNPTISNDLAESLKRFDNEGKKVISYAELAKIMTTLGVKLLEEEADRMIRKEKSIIISQLKFII